MWCAWGTLLLAGCGAGTVSPPGSPLLTIVSASQNLGTAGGSIALSDGSAVNLAANIIPSSQSISVTHAPAQTAAAPSAAWQPVPGVMTVAFATPVPVEPAPSAGATLMPALSMTMPFPAASATAILAARAPVALISYADGTSAKLSPDGTFDTAADTVSLTLPREALDGAVSVQLSLDVDGTVPVPSYGPRYWNGSAWQSTPIALDPAKKTLVFVHGIFSSVETAFPCVNAILAAGGYQQAVGLDYDWTQPPYAEAPILAAFINGLPNAGVDIEAHSYGTVVTLATLPSITKSVGHVALLGGPLPSNGSPQADPGYLRDLLVNVAEYVEPPSLVERAVNSGMVDSLASGSATMQSIQQGILALPNPPKFVEAAGYHPLPFEQMAGVHFAYEVLFGFFPNDGVVEVQSAQSQSFAHTILIAGEFPDDHLQLECDDPSILSFVGKYMTQ